MKKIFCLFPIIVECSSSLFGMKIDRQIFRYLSGNAIVCFDAKLPERRDMMEKIKSSKISDKLSCIKICCALIGQSLFGGSDNSSKLAKVISLLSDDENKSYVGELMQSTKTVFSRLSNSTDSNYLHKLAFFAPTGAKRLDIATWLSKFNSFVCDGQNNYELSTWNKKYDLELALSMMFTPVDFHFWDSNKDKTLYIQNMCGAIRTYLYYVEGKTIGLRANQTMPSSSIILKECYDFFDLKNNVAQSRLFDEKIHKD